jgi:hypothetical protein
LAKQCMRGCSKRGSFFERDSKSSRRAVRAARDLAERDRGVLSLSHYKSRLTVTIIVVHVPYAGVVYPNR